MEGGLSYYVICGVCGAVVQHLLKRIMCTCDQYTYILNSLTKSNENIVHVASTYKEGIYMLFTVGCCEHLY